MTIPYDAHGSIGFYISCKSDGVRPSIGACSRGSTHARGYSGSFARSSRLLSLDFSKCSLESSLDLGDVDLHISVPCTDGLTSALSGLDLLQARRRVDGPNDSSRLDPSSWGSPRYSEHPSKSNTAQGAARSRVTARSYRFSSIAVHPNECPKKSRRPADCRVGTIAHSALRKVQLLAPLLGIPQPCTSYSHLSTMRHKVVR